MKKTDFIDQLRAMLLREGFTYFQNHFYKAVSCEVVIVFGLQWSSYGKYCYIEYGYAFVSINKHMPYPKFNQLNLNCGRVMTDKGMAIEYTNIDSDFMIRLEKTINNLIETMNHLIAKGRDELIHFYLSGTGNQSWYIMGVETAAYFGLGQDSFKYHFVKGS